MMKSLLLSILIICVTLLNAPLCYSKTTVEHPSTELSCNKVEQKENQLRSVYCCQVGDLSCQENLSCSACASGCCTNLINFISSTSSLQMKLYLASLTFALPSHHQKDYINTPKKPPRLA